VRLLHAGVDDAEHLRIRIAGGRGLGACVTLPSEVDAVLETIGFRIADQLSRISR
jgi:hypothetical protein